MNIFLRLRNSSCLSPSCDYQMNGRDIRLGYTNLRGILGGKRTIRYKSISDILISMFSGVNKCSQGRNIFVIDFGLSRYQIFVISLIRISAEFPTYIVHYQNMKYDMPKLGLFISNYLSSLIDHPISGFCMCNVGINPLHHYNQLFT